MEDIQARLIKLQADADDCDLIANLAMDPLKQAYFRRLAQQLRQMADDIHSIIDGKSGKDAA